MENIPFAEGLNFAGMYAQAASMPVQQPFVDYRFGPQGKVDLGSITEQQYDINPWNAIGYVGKGASTGFSMGGPQGAAVGAAIGLGAGAIDMGRQLYNRGQFRSEQQRLLTQGSRQNQLVDYRKKVMSPLRDYNQYRKFYG